MSHLYVGTRGGLLVVDEADPLAMQVQFPGSRVETVVVDSGHPNRVYAGLFSGQEIRGTPDLQSSAGLRGVWRSDDAGATWSDVSAGLDHSATASLAIRGNGGEYGVLYAGSEPSSLAFSRDGGASWQRGGDLTVLPSSSSWAFPPRPSTHHVRWISLDPVERDRIYLCIEAGALIQSHDGGTTWVDRTPDGPIDTHTLAVHPLAPGRLYSAAGDGFMQHGRGYAESPDRGDTWVRFGDGLRHHYLYGLAVDSADPDTVLVSAAASPDRAHDPTRAESYVYRRQHGGPWELAMSGLPAPDGMTTTILTAHPARGGVFFAGSNQGLFRSDDAGQSWAPVLPSWPEEYRDQNTLSIAVAD